MPAAWIGAGASLIGAVSSLGGGGGGSSATGNTRSGYVPTNLGGEDLNWQNAITGSNDLANNAQMNVLGGFEQSLNNANAINYAPYQAGANRAGQEYGMLANQGNFQQQIYGNQAGLAAQQQQGLYGDANAIAQRAFDPNMAQYNQIQQQLAGQVNAGQAARGLGNSPVGGQEFNNAMSNFNTQWNTQQLQNEALGGQAAAGLSNAGGAQGQLVGANLAAQQNVGQNAAGYYQQAGQVPITAQQYIGQQPAAAGLAYSGELGNLQSMYGNVGQQASAYLNGGIGPSQNQAQYAQNQLNGGLSALGSLANSANQPGSWLNNMFSSNNYAPGASGGQAQAAASAGDIFSGIDTGGYT